MSHRQKPFLESPVATTSESTIVPVYVIRTHEDLRYVSSITEPKSLLPLGEYMMNAGLLTSDILGEALSMQRSMPGRRIGWIIKTLGHCDDLTLGQIIAAHLGVPCVTLGSFQPDRDYRRITAELELIYDGAAILHEESNHVWVAADDVTNPRPGKVVADKLGKGVMMVMASLRDITVYFQSYGKT